MRVNLFFLPLRWERVGVRVKLFHTPSRLWEIVWVRVNLFFLPLRWEIVWVRVNLFFLPLRWERAWARINSFLSPSPVGEGRGEGQIISYPLTSMGDCLGEDYHTQKKRTKTIVLILFF